tara:strand:- start:76 stop:432 length:357 start_codon:yes stop_codon:yes gene_type:complete
MRLTESRLRRIIRDVIAESMSGRPDTAEEVEQYLQDFRANQEASRSHKQSMTQIDAHLKIQEDIETMMKTLSMMSKSEIRDKVSGNARLTRLAGDLKYDHNSLSALAAALVKSGTSIF